MKSTRCSACKYSRKRCPPDCIFSPYFPSNDPQRYACAQCRVEDPVYGCVKFVSQLQDEIHVAMKELAKTQAKIKFLVASMGDGSGFEPLFDYYYSGWF
ncbi:hypothetical protein V2J09_001796 [Rumex salicifolius]